MNEDEEGQQKPSRTRVGLGVGSRGGPHHSQLLVEFGVTEAKGSLLGLVLPKC